MSSPILVTGSHRSGTTWAGRILTLSGEACEIHEPFNPRLYRSWLSRLPDHWFYHVDPTDPGRYSEDLARIVQLRPPLGAMLRRVRSPKQAAMVLREHGRAWNARRTGARPLLKDPIALFSAEWLASAHSCQVLVLIRHPGAFAGSLKRLNWAFDFCNLTRQPRLVEAYLSAYADAIAAAARAQPDLIDQAILLWRLCAVTALTYRRTHPDWQIRRYEDLALDPSAQFRGLYDAFGLSWSPQVEQGVQALCGPQNPEDVDRGDRGGVARDSAAATRTWKRRLTREEIQRVRAGTADLAANFYDDADWEDSEVPG